MPSFLDACRSEAPYLFRGDSFSDGSIVDNDVGDTLTAVYDALDHIGHGPALPAIVMVQSCWRAFVVRQALQQANVDAALCRLWCTYENYILGEKTCPCKVLIDIRGASTEGDTDGDAPSKTW